MVPPSSAPHPGKRIKTEVIPAGMSVTKAAQLMGVGRPALSNLLNGKAALSADMAARLERAFGYPLRDLLEMQARYEAAQAVQQDAPADTKAYVPPFLAITANDIERWVSGNIRARSRLAVLLRTLVHSTGRGLTKVDFPGNDDSERPGWDGAVEASEGTPWVPGGRSGWEFGTSEDAKTKADGDFNKSVRALDQEERAETTFVFVTPRRWAKKEDWVASKRAAGLWKDVRAYDAVDLEQWVEQSLPAQTWFANETHVPADGVRSLDKCWSDWADVSSPPLTGALFDSAIEATKRTMLSRLAKPSDAPILIAADSTEEALAFLAQALSVRGGEELVTYRDRVLVFDKPGVFPRLATGALAFIPVAFTRDVERELAPHTTSMPSIVVYPRSAANTTPDIVLEPASYETFNKALGQMGKSRDEISRLSDASGRSLTVLRRQLATVPALRTPTWGGAPQAATRLVPFLLVGVWSSTNEADKLGLSLLANRSYEDLEKECHSFSQLNDAPTWAIGVVRGVVSKIDLLFSIAGVVTREDLRRFFDLAEMVLGEDDPALDLNEDQRWLAAIHGKTREFSRAFRDGISETLVLLAVHGAHLFKGHLGFDTEAEAARLVRELLPSPLTSRVLEANDRDLPTYAEAAPDEFLSILERDLKSDVPAALSLLRPADSGLFGHPRRTGLLWALEGLAWNPATLPRAALILARLAQVEINDNWTNKPANSLASIFRAWMPQTAATHEQRVALLRKLVKKFPDAAWKVCVAQFGGYRQLGHYSHKPRWRSDGYGFGEPLSTWEPIRKFVRETIEMALNWDAYSLDMLSDLVGRLSDLNDPDQARVWALVETWARTKATDAEKAALREKIRVSTLSRRAKKHARSASLATSGKAAYSALAPTDLLNRYAWLFREGWVEESADELEGDEPQDFQRREERMATLRTDALRDIATQRGLSGLLELSARGQTSGVIGMLAATRVLRERELVELIRSALASTLAGKDEHSCKSLIWGALTAITDDDARERIISRVSASFAEADAVSLLVLAPFRRSTWRLVDARGEMAATKYWAEVTPDSIHHIDAESSEIVERLLKAKRPRAAFWCVRFDPGKLDPQLLCRLMSAVAAGSDEQPNQYVLEQYHVKRAFARLNETQVVSLDQMAALEFAYIEALSRPWDKSNNYGIPNLERYIELHPELFVQAIAWAFKRSDKTIDPPEFKVSPERVEVMAERAYKLLEGVQRIPGRNHLGELEASHLAQWVDTVRQMCGGLARVEIGDECIGKMLSCAPIGKDDVWPCEPVRDVMESIQSEALMRGAQVGVYNSRGVQSRGEGGQQERELAEKYRKWSQALQISHPFVASKLLMDLANTYDREASREDADAGIRRRLR
jgi:addiction module HigA family antidote